MTRLELLAQRHWSPFLHLPGLAALPEPALRAADSFFGFVAQYGVADPQPSDIAVWASFDGDDAAQRIAQLSKAMAVLIPAFVGRVGEAAAALPRGKATSGVSAPAPDVGSTAALRRPVAHDWDPVARPVGKASRNRTVSVDPWELPADIQDILRRMSRGIPGNDVVVSPQIMRRLREKMCQFAWSAQQAGLPVALSEEAVLRYQEDVTARSRDGKNGLRWATVRASIEEIYRYVRYTGAPEAILKILAKDYAILESRENRQKALKHAALARTGNTTMSLLDQADDLLGAADVAAKAKKRHQMRNAACILGIYPVAPLRNASAYLVLGVTLFWRNGAWVIDTVVPPGPLRHAPRASARALHRRRPARRQAGTLPSPAAAAGARRGAPALRPARWHARGAELRAADLQGADEEQLYDDAHDAPHRPLVEHRHRRPRDGHGRLPPGRQGDLPEVRDRPGRHQRRQSASGGCQRATRTAWARSGAGSVTSRSVATREATGQCRLALLRASKMFRHMATRTNIPDNLFKTQASRRARRAGT
jgi:hypothetical protein